MTDTRIPKKEYFLQRLQDAIAKYDQGKQIYYLMRYKQQVELEAEAAQKLIDELSYKAAPVKRGELKKKEFVFSFHGGGWNSVYAKTRRGAEKLMREQYGDMNPVEGSCHTVTPEQYRQLLNSFN